MLKTTTRLIGLGVVLAALVLAPGAEAKAKHSYQADILTATLQTDNGYPGVGGTALIAGSLDSSAFGSGAVVDHVTVTGIEGSVVSFEGTEVDYYARGTQRNTFTGTATIASDGSQSLAVNGRFTGGTGRYKGAKGRYEFEGTVAAGATIVVGHSSGRVAY
jgi:hypothetical protein